MALERRNPLPAGTYWLDVFGANREKLAAWRREHAASVRVVASESFESDPPRDWVKFVVSVPVAWDAKTFGFPTIIPTGVKVDSSGDTVQRPPPEKDPLDSLGDTLASPATKLVTAAVVLVGVVVFANLVTLGPRRAVR